MRRITEEELCKKYRHFTERNFPFEDTIVDVYALKHVPYSDRWSFLKSIFLITSKGYYIKYEDICGPYSHCDADVQPYDIFLEGTIKCAYSYAFNASIDDTLIFIKNILSTGKICVSRYYDYRERHFVMGHFQFKFSLPWYSWIAENDRNN